MSPELCLVPRSHPFSFLRLSCRRVSSPTWHGGKEAAAWPRGSAGLLRCPPEPHPPPRGDGRGAGHRRRRGRQTVPRETRGRHIPTRPVTPPHVSTIEVTSFPPSRVNHFAIPGLCPHPLLQSPDPNPRTVAEGSVPQLRLHCVRLEWSETVAGASSQARNTPPSGRRAPAHHLA